MALSAFDAKVCDALLGLVENNGSGNTGFFKTYGDDFYPIFQEMLVISGKRLTTIPQKQQKSQKQSQKKTVKEQIVFDNTMKKIKEKTTRILSIIEGMYSEKSTTVSDYIMTNEIVDVRSTGFMYLSLLIFEQAVETKTAFSVIVSLQRYIKAVKELVCSHVMTGSDTKVPKLLIDDLELYLEKNIEKYNFRGDTLYEVEPALIVESQWDKHAPRPQVRPFSHQKLLSDIILSIGRPFEHESVKTPFKGPLKAAYVEVRVLTSAGKTTSIVNVAAAVKKYQTVIPNIKVYAVCAIEPIRRRWATLLSYSKIQYFSHDDIDVEQSTEPKRHRGKYKSDAPVFGVNRETNSQDAEKQHANIRNSVVIICSPEQALKYLSENPNSILFYDEPTIYSDGTNMLRLMNGVSVLKLMPRFTFLCSATLDIPNHELYNAHKKRFPDSVFIDVFSPEIYGYSNVRTLDGIIVTPHMCCKSRAELEQTIKRLDTVPLLGKFYNPLVVRQLFDSMKKAGVVDIPDVDKIFGDVENLSPDTVRKVAFSLLKELVKCSDSQITEICKLSKTGQVVRFENLGTCDAQKYQHTNLIATANPVEFAEKNFHKIADDIKAEIGSYEKILAPYEEWCEQRDDILSKIKTDDERARFIEEYESSKPKCYVPEKFQINTFEHIRKYGKSSPSGRCRVPFLEILDCGHVSETIDFLAQAGVGVYKQSAFNREYTELLMGSRQKQGLVTDGRMEFVVADADVAYGIDCPFGGLFVDSDLCKVISLNTLFQLISRVGRGRKSPYANIFIDRVALSNIMEMVRDDEYENEETDTLLQVYNKVSCSFFTKKSPKKPTVLVNIPFKPEHTRFKIENNEVFLYKGDEVVWKGNTKYPHDVVFDISNGTNLISLGETMGIVFN